MNKFSILVLVSLVFLAGCTTTYNGPNSHCNSNNDCAIGLTCVNEECAINSNNHQTINKSNTKNDTTSNALIIPNTPKTKVPEFTSIDFFVSVPYWTKGEVYLANSTNATLVKLTKVDNVTYKGHVTIDKNKEYFFTRGTLNTKSTTSFKPTDTPKGLYSVIDWVDSNKSIKIPNFQKGVIFGGMLWRQEDLAVPNIIDYNLDLAKSYGVEWISLVNTWYEFPNASSMEEIKPFYTSDGEYPDTHGWSTPSLTNEQMEEIITKAHNRGMKVFLKPGIVSFGYGPDNPEGGDVKPSKGWDYWFKEYTKFVIHFADLAEKNNVEMYAIGTELDVSSIEELANQGAPPDATDRWRKVIKTVREHYSGKITFSISCQLNDPTDWSAFPCHAPKHIKFWDDLDYIGFEPYFPITKKTDPSLEELKINFAEKIDSQKYTYAKQLYEEYHKPIIFTELSFRSWDGSNFYQLQSPPNPQLDLKEQWEQYEAMFQTIENRTWIQGAYPWAWYLIKPTDDMKWQMKDAYGPFVGKPAGQVIKKWYQKINS